MFQINGVIQLVPGTVHTESGTLRADENNVQPAVIQTFETLSGPVQVIFPADAVDGVVEGLNKAKEEAKNKHGNNSDLYIPSSMNEAETIAKAQEALVKGEKDEVKGS